MALAKNISAGQADRYYDKDDYYTKDAAAPSQWYGKGARALGLNGLVRPEDFKALVRGELPDGTTRVNAFMDSSLRENCIQKITLALTVKGDRMILDFRGTAPQFLNRAVNTNIASFKAALCTGLLAHWFGPRAMFAYAIVMGLPAIAAALAVDNGHIDARLARG